MIEDPVWPQGLLEAIKSAEAVSLDIFDTALVRKVEQPVDLFLILALEAGLKAPHEFVAARIQAERRARDSAWVDRGAFEVTLDAIYQQLEHDPVLEGLDVSVVLGLERALELRLSNRHPFLHAVYQTARKLNKRVGFLSDIYLDRPLIESMLQKSGYESPDFLMISSETGSTKAHGGLFDEALDHLLIPPQSLLHIGDNLDSDVHRARSKGVAAFHITKVSEGLRETIAGKRFLRQSLAPLSLKKNPSSEGSAARDLWVSLWRGLVAKRAFLNEEDVWFQLGYDYVGILLLGFGLWIDAEAKKSGVSDLYFLARDGHVLLKVHEKLLERGMASIHRARYLFASRRALNVPAMSEVDEGVCDFLVSGTSRLSVKDFLQRVGLNPSHFVDEIKAAGFDGPLQCVDDGLSYGRLRALFRSLAPELLAVASQERALLYRYWEQEGVFRADHCGIVDIGWHGSLQDSMCRLMGQYGQSTKVTGLYLGTYAAAKDREAKGARHQAYLFKAGEPQPLLQAVKGSIELFEWFFCAPHGSVLGFQESPEGQISPLFESGVLEAAREGSAARLQLGALAFIDDALSAFQEGHQPPLVPPDLAIALIEELLHHPTLEEVSLLGTIPHAEGFGGVSQVRPMIDPIPALWNPLNLKRLISDYKTSFWRPGYRRRLRSMLWL